MKTPIEEKKESNLFDVKKIIYLFIFSLFFFLFQILEEMMELDETALLQY